MTLVAYHFNKEGGKYGIGTVLFKVVPLREHIEAAISDKCDPGTNIIILSVSEIPDDVAANLVAPFVVKEKS